MIDLRSDTVTKPCPAMRKAMAMAEVGDDVFGDDPTVQMLEKQTAGILGKEAAVYMPSGTMTNQVAIRSHTEHGDEILVDSNTHVFFYEAGAPAALSGVSCRLLPGVRGIFSAKDIECVLRPRNIHFPVTKLVCIENTHNRGGGSIWPIDRIREIHDTAKANNLKMHLDGARLWNASAASGIPEHEYASYFDSVSVCFSKGLGAPVGSALAGDAPFIERARRFRKQFGGGMRQAGIIAAGALYALEHNRARIAIDHDNARIFAEGIHVVPGIEIDLDTVETNIVILRLTMIPAGEFLQKLKEAGVLLHAAGQDTIRAVTHLDVSRDNVEDAIVIIRHVLEHNRY